MKIILLIAIILSACASQNVEMTDEEKLQYLKDNTFVNRYNTVNKDLVVIYMLRQTYPKNRSFCLNGDSTFNVAEVRSTLKKDGYMIQKCAKGISSISLTEVFEPEENLYTFKYMAWNGPLAASSQQCKVKITEFSKKEDIQCKVLWIS